mgnify:CR=1 FL=1
MRTAEFAYDLPEAFIATHPRPRGSSRLLVLERESGAIWQSSVGSLPALLQPGDVLLLNDVRVIPARLWGERAGGGRCELLLLRPAGEGAWEVMARPSSRLKVGATLRFSWGEGSVVEKRGGGRVVVRFSPTLSLRRLQELGEVPLPPYIAKKRPPLVEDRSRYQTVFARQGHAVAAPTAGLHFTWELLAACEARGVEIATLTLHVGPGTFVPVKSQDPREHQLEPELYAIPPHTAHCLNAALRQKRRIVCVGTTAVRALEDALARGAGKVRPGEALATAFILPGYTFRGTGALLTNFHLPRSTLLMLVSAFAGRERVLAAYEQAKLWGFGFYSYGDAMLVL